MTITAPLWGVALGFLVVFACLFYGAWNEEVRNAEADLRRHRHLSDDEIDNDYAAGE